MDSDFRIELATQIKKTDGDCLWINYVRIKPSGEYEISYSTYAYNDVSIVVWPQSIKLTNGSFPSSSHAYDIHDMIYRYIRTSRRDDIIRSVVGD